MSEIAITFDVDWAPDFVIDAVAEGLRRAEARATWMVTHDSPAIRRLADEPALFELGIHPNFMPGSTHGDTIPTVLQHCLSLVPDATCLRTHALCWSAAVLETIAAGTPLQRDVSIFMPNHRGLEPVTFHTSTRPITRLPFVWEDDVQMLGPRPTWDPAPLLEPGGGLTIINFHPIHVYLNSAQMEPYEQLKRVAPDLSRATRRQADPLVGREPGTATFLETLLDRRLVLHRIRDLAAEPACA